MWGLIGTFYIFKNNLQERERERERERESIEVIRSNRNMDAANHTLHNEERSNEVISFQGLLYY